MPHVRGIHVGVGWEQAWRTPFPAAVACIHMGTVAPRICQTKLCPTPCRLQLLRRAAPGRTSDSNAATSATSCCYCRRARSPLWGLSPRPYAYGAHALPAELRRQLLKFLKRNSTYRGLAPSSCPMCVVYMLAWVGNKRGAPHSQPQWLASTWALLRHEFAKQNYVRPRADCSCCAGQLPAGLQTVMPQHQLPAAATADVLKAPCGD